MDMIFNGFLIGIGLFIAGVFIAIIFSFFNRIL